MYTTKHYHYCELTISYSTSYPEVSDDEVGKYHLLDEGDGEGAVLVAAWLWPVLSALLCIALGQVCHHDNHRDFLLPYQSPKVGQGALHRT